MGFGREGAICELDEIMQILPGSSDDKEVINASARFGNLAAGPKLMSGFSGVRRGRLFQEHDQEAETNVEQGQHEEGIAITHHDRLAMNDLRELFHRHQRHQHRAVRATAGS